MGLCKLHAGWKFLNPDSRLDEGGITERVDRSGNNLS